MEVVQVSSWMVFTVIGAWAVTTIIAIIGALPQLKRTRAQNSVDDANAATIYRKIVVDMQLKMDELEARLDHAHLDIGLSIQMGEKPEITSWKWGTLVEELPNKD